MTNNKKCYVCEQYARISKTTPNKQPVCNKCSKKIRKYESCGQCNDPPWTYDDCKNPICKECYIELCKCEKCETHLPIHKKQNVCEKCSPPRIKKMGECAFCRNLSPIENIKAQACKRCNGKINTGICGDCGKDEYIITICNIKSSFCSKCFIKKIENCNFCNKTDFITKSINRQNICNSCYKKQGCKNHKCSVCNETRKVENWKNKQPICKHCYVSPLQLCINCNETRPAKKRINKGIICDNCYAKNKRDKNEKSRVIQLLRSRFSNFLRKYSLNGKIQPSDEYGVNYHKIIEHIGPCPGNREDYHIDHIFPLFAFNFNNIKHITIAFSPENHRWLKKEDNLKKGKKYNRQNFKEFLNAQMRKL